MIVNLLIFATFISLCLCVNDIDEGLDASLEIAKPGLDAAIRSIANESCSDLDCIESISYLISESFSDSLQSYRNLLKHQLLTCIHSAPKIKNESAKDYKSRILNYSLKEAESIQQSFLDHTGQTWNNWRKSDFGDLIEFKRKMIAPTIFNELSANLIALSLAYPAYKLLKIVNTNLFMMSYALGILLMNKIIFGIWIRPISLKRKRRRGKRPVA